MIMVAETKNDCAGVGQQQFTGLDWKVILKPIRAASNEGKASELTRESELKEGLYQNLEVQPLSARWEQPIFKGNTPPPVAQLD
jgi:hypothetical protein